MAKNAVTDTHVGASPASWDHDGFAEVRHQLGFNEDVAPRHRGKGKTVVAPSHSDFRLGSQVVATIKQMDGYMAWFLCRVIDAYAEHDRWGQDGKVFVVILETASEKFDWLRGHVREMNYLRGSRWGYGSYSMLHHERRVSIADFRGIPRDLVKKG